MRLRPPLASRNGEDHILLTAFEDQRDGFFIDVGAFDGVYQSNTWALEQYGWRGVCLEPAPSIFPLLVRNRPGALCYEAAASAENRRVKFFMDPTRLFSSVVSENAVRTEFNETAKAWGIRESSIQTTTAEAIRLNAILRRVGTRRAIDVISIDVNGTESDVLEGLDLDLYRPRVILVSVAEDNRDSVDERLRESGYRLARSLANRQFYAQETDLIAHIGTIRINCHIQRNLHPFGWEFTHPDSRHDRWIAESKSYTTPALVSTLRSSKVAPGNAKRVSD